MTLLLLSLPALAQSVILEISEEIQISGGGTWARVIAQEDGLKLVQGQSGDFVIMDLEPDGDGWWADLGVAESLTERSDLDLKDHCMVQCPDGTWLHVGSANVSVPNDSAYSFRYDADFNKIAEAAVDEENASLAHNDLPCVCTEQLTGVAFGNMDPSGKSPFFFLDEDGAPTGQTAELNTPARPNGASFLVEEDRVLFAGYGHNPELQLVEMSFDLQTQETHELNPMPAGWKGYWPQRMLKLGDYYFLAVMGQDTSVPPEGDEGDVFLVVLDADLQPVETRQVSDNPQGAGGMRPWLTWDYANDQLLLSYDRDTAPRMHVITLDLEGLGEIDTGSPGGEGDDGGGDDGGADGGGGDTGADDKDGGCGGCASGGPAPHSALVGAFAALAALARRPATRPRPRPRR